MKKEKNELLQFVGGLAMLAVGLYFFMAKVHVTTIWGYGGLFGISWMSSGLVVVPFVIGVIMMFVSPKSLWGKIVAGLGLLIIIASVIASTQLYLSRITLYEWLLMLVLIFGGAGLVARVLLHDPDKRKSDRYETSSRSKTAGNEEILEDVDKELEELRNKMK